MLNYVGPFISLNVLQTNYPNGGKEGDYADISGRNYYWVKSRGKWIPEYSSLEVLKKENPNPQRGDLAFVGTKNPLDIYLHNGDAWTDTGEDFDMKPSISAPFVQVGTYNRDQNELKQELENKLDNTFASETYATKSELDNKADTKSVNEQIAKKVDKDGNKQLSDENFTKALKEKLESIERGANVFSGDYNDLANLPKIPTSIDELTGTEKFLTEHQDISKKVDVVDFSDIVREEVTFEIVSYSGKSGIVCYYPKSNRFICKVLQLGTSVPKFYLASLNDPQCGKLPIPGNIYRCKNRVFIGTASGLQEVLDYEITTITV